MHDKRPACGSIGGANYRAFIALLVAALALAACQAAVLALQLAASVRAEPRVHMAGAPPAHTLQLSAEDAEKLAGARPATLAAAQRIPGAPALLPRLLAGVTAMSRAPLARWRTRSVLRVLRSFEGSIFKRLALDAQLPREPIRQRVCVRLEPRWRPY